MRNFCEMKNEVNFITHVIIIRLDKCYEFVRITMQWVFYALFARAILFFSFLFLAIHIFILVFFPSFSAIDLLILRFIIIIINTCARGTNSILACIFMFHRRSFDRLFSSSVSLHLFSFYSFEMDARACTNLTFSFSIHFAATFFFSESSHFSSPSISICFDFHYLDFEIESVCFARSASLR